MRALAMWSQGALVDASDYALDGTPCERILQEGPGYFADVQKFLARLKIFLLAESLGGVESLVNHPELMTHASVPRDRRADRS